MKTIRRTLFLLSLSTTAIILAIYLSKHPELTQQVIDTNEVYSNED